MLQFNVRCFERLCSVCASLFADKEPVLWVSPPVAWRQAALQSLVYDALTPDCVEWEDGAWAESGDDW